jgi:hypothetical protein
VSDEPTAVLVRGTAVDEGDKSSDVGKRQTADREECDGNHDDDHDEGHG